MFADDTALYLNIEGADGLALQKDLDKLAVWEARWDMEFNPSKCQMVQVTGSRKPINCTNRLHGHVLETVTSAKYFGVDVSSGLTWNSHIDRITGNANKTLGFLKRNIKTKMPRIRETANNTLVRPQLEYASAVWDPHTKDKVNQIELVQRRAARWTCSNYDRKASVIEMVINLGWCSLEQRRADASLYLFYKIVYGIVAIPLPDHIQRSTKASRFNSMTFRQVYAS